MKLFRKYNCVFTQVLLVHSDDRELDRSIAIVNNIEHTPETSSDDKFANWQVSSNCSLFIYDHKLHQRVYLACVDNSKGW